MTPTFAYYNDNDPFCVEWLKNLVKAGLIPAGEVDGRSIVDVQPEDLAGFRQCHFFAGIGGFALAARMAGWPDDMVLWTGGFPHREFGEQKAENDALWSEFSRLVQLGRPRWLLAENFSLGLDRALDSLETDGYATRAFRIGGREWICAATDCAGAGRGGRQDITAWRIDYGARNERVSINLDDTSTESHDSLPQIAAVILREWLRVMP